MSYYNKYGLSRNIPNEIKRIVRKKYGFGCIICGCAIYEYHHYNPPFSEAKEHNPEKIVLLCGKCHDHISRGIWSEEKIKISSNNPKCLEQGYSQSIFDFQENKPEIIFGPSTWINTTIIINVFNKPVLIIEEPEEEKTPYRLSGLFYDDKSNCIFKIIENEWHGLIENWDIEITGRTLIIRRELRKVALKLTIYPPNKIIFDKININYKGALIKGEKDKKFIINHPNGSNLEMTDSFGDGCDYGIDITDKGIIIGSNCKSMKIKSIKLWRRKNSIHKGSL